MTTPPPVHCLLSNRTVNDLAQALEYVCGILAKDDGVDLVIDSEGVTIRILKGEE